MTVRSFAEQLEIDRNNVHDPAYGNGVVIAFETSGETLSVNGMYFNPLVEDDGYGYDHRQRNPHVVVPAHAVSGFSLLADVTEVTVNDETWNVRNVSKPHAGRITVYLK